MQQLRGTWATSILGAVHDSPGISRAQLVRELGLSSGLATETVARLRDRRLVDEIAAPGTGGRGRPTRSLVAHPQGPVIAVVVISHEEWELSVAELGAATLMTERHRHDRQWKHVCSAVRAGLRRLHQRMERRVVGLCVSVPGTVSGERLIQASMLGWGELDLSTLRPSGVSWPLLAGNDATLSALGEARRGTARAAQSVVHLHMHNGIGGALIDGGRIVTGARGMAGEFGHMPFARPTDLCRCGAYGCWNTALDGAAFAGRVGRAAENEVSLIAEVIEDAAQRPGPERRAVRSAARALGRGIAALVNAHDPALVCLSGLAPSVRATAPEVVDDAYTRGLMSSRAVAPPSIVDGCLGERAALVGAAEQAFDRFLASVQIDSWDRP
jgi:predicted NBD/HSP70 family sugar kinase